MLTLQVNRLNGKITRSIIMSSARNLRNTLRVKKTSSEISTQHAKHSNFIKLS